MKLQKIATTNEDGLPKIQLNAQKCWNFLLEMWDQMYTPEKKQNYINSKLKRLLSQFVIKLRTSMRQKVIHQKEQQRMFQH